MRDTCGGWRPTTCGKRCRPPKEMARRERNARLDMWISKSVGDEIRVKRRGEKSITKTIRGRHAQMPAMSQQNHQTVRPFEGYLKETVENEKEYHKEQRQKKIG